MLVAHRWKYKKLVPTLALVNHLAADGICGISKEALLQALKFVNCLDSHAQRIYSCLVVYAIGESAREIIKKIKDGELADGFKQAIFQRTNWHKLTKKDPVREALDLLVDLGWLATSNTTIGCGRPSKIYFIHPKTYE